MQSRRTARAARRVRGGTALRGRERRGFALLEVLVGSALVSIALSSLLLVVLAYGKFTRLAHERTTAQEAARRMLEAMHDVPFGEVFATFNAVPGDDPGGPGTAPGRDFDVPGLDPQRKDVDGLCGEVWFPAVYSKWGNTATLREDWNEPLLGMPRDLNANKKVDQQPHGHDYVLLPVKVTVRWRGVAGDSELTVHQLLSYR